MPQESLFSLESQANTVNARMDEIIKNGRFMESSHLLS